MTVEAIINKISETSKETGKDLGISAVIVREELRVAGELTPEIDDNIEKANEFYRQMLLHPDVSKRFLEERFENLSYEDWLKEITGDSEEQ